MDEARCPRCGGMLVLKASGEAFEKCRGCSYELFEEVEKARLQRAAEQNEPRAVQLFCQFDMSNDMFRFAIRVENGLGGVQLAHVLVSPEIPGDVGRFFNLVSRVAGVKLQVPAWSTQSTRTPLDTPPAA